jgi:predicted transcriptional regulator
MPALGDLEVQVMRRIWARGEPVTVRDVLGNLRKKGWLRRHAAGRVYRYEPLVSAAEYSAGLVRQALAASGDRPAVLMHFIEELSADEADALEEAYRRLTRQRLTRQRQSRAGNGQGGAR